MTDIPIDNIVPFNDGQVRWADGFINLLAGLGVQGRDKFASQQYAHSPLNVVDLENAYRSDWIARKVVTIPAWDMTREWRSWQADPDQIELLEEVEKKLFIQMKLQQALIKARLYGGACIIIGVDAGKPEEELDLEDVGQDSLKFIHVVSRQQLRAGPIIRDISSKYFGQPEFYEAANEPAPKTFQQEPEEGGKPLPAFAARNVKLHPSRVVKLIGMDTADQMLNDIWGDSVLQAVNDAVKMCGLVTGSLATLVAELKVDVIKIPELKSILSTAQGEKKMLARFSAANAAKSVINTIMIDGNEEWQRIQASLTGVPETLMAYMQIAAGAADIPATRFLGMSPAGLNATGESDIRNYYDRLAAEQTTVLTPTMTILDEVLIRSALGDRPPEVWYDWGSLWQLSDNEKAELALKKAQAYKIDVDAAQLPVTALANARANQLIEDGTYPGLEKALEEAAIEGDTIEEANAPPPMDPAMEAMAAAAENGEIAPPGPPKPGGFPPKKPSPFGAKKKPALMVVGGDGLIKDREYVRHPKGSAQGGKFAPSAYGPHKEELGSNDPDRVMTPAEEKEAREAYNRPENVREYEHKGVNYSLPFDDPRVADKFANEAEYKEIGAALDAYKTSPQDRDDTAYDINAQLRDGGEMTPAVKDAVDKIDRAFDLTAEPIRDYHTKEPKDAWLYRGISNRVQGDFKVGDEFQDDGYGSASINKGFAKDWAQAKGPGGTLMKITVPAGHKVLPLQDRSSGKGEEGEVLLRRGTRYRVEKAGKNMEVRVIG